MSESGTDVVSAKGLSALGSESDDGALHAGAEARDAAREADWSGPKIFARILARIPV